MPSRERVITMITVEADEVKDKDTTVEEQAQGHQHLEHDTTIQSVFVPQSSAPATAKTIPAATASPSPAKKNSAAKSQQQSRTKKEVSPNQRTLGSFFLQGKTMPKSKTTPKPKPKSKGAASAASSLESLPVSASVSPSTSTTNTSKRTAKSPEKKSAKTADTAVKKTAVTPLSVPAKSHASPTSSKSSLETSSSIINSNRSPSTPMEDIMAIVLGAHGGDSPLKSMPFPIPKRKMSKVLVCGVDVQTLLPSMVKPVKRAIGKGKGKAQTQAQANDGSKKMKSKKSKQGQDDSSVTSNSSANTNDTKDETHTPNAATAAGSKRKQPSDALPITDTVATTATTTLDPSSSSPSPSPLPSVNILLGRKKTLTKSSNVEMPSTSLETTVNELQPRKKAKFASTSIPTGIAISKKDDDDSSESTVMDGSLEGEALPQVVEVVPVEIPTATGIATATIKTTSPVVHQLQPRKKKQSAKPIVEIKKDEVIKAAPLPALAAVNQLQPRKKKILSTVKSSKEGKIVEKDPNQKKDVEVIINKVTELKPVCSPTATATAKATTTKTSTPLAKVSATSEEKPKTFELSNEDSELFSKYETMRNKYADRATELIARATGGSLSEEDFQKEAIEGTLLIPSAALSSGGEEDVGFMDEWVGQLSAIVQGSPLSVDDLARIAQNKLIGSLDDSKFVSVELVASKIKLIATRTQYLFPVPKSGPANVDIFSNTNPEFMWRWELVSLDLLPEQYKATVKVARSTRRKVKNHEKAVIKLIQAINGVMVSIKSTSSADKKQKLIAKVSVEEEKVLKYEREEEKVRLLNDTKILKEKQKEMAKKQKDEEKKRLEEDKRKEKLKAEEAKKVEKALKLEENDSKRTKALEKKAAEEMKQKSRLMSFFQGAATPRHVEPAKIPVCAPVTLSVIKHSSFDSEKFWSALGSGEEISNPFADSLSKQAKRSRKRKVGTTNVRVFVPTVSDNPFEQQVYDEEKSLPIRNRYKFLCFREDFRPPYHGTWSKPLSTLISGRNPYAKDTAYLDYDVDSEEEWEEGDDEQGEDCSENGNDDEEMVDDEEGDITMYNYQDGWLAEDGDLELEDDDEESQELRKRKVEDCNSSDAVGTNLNSKFAAAFVIAPLKGGIPQAFAGRSIVPDSVEGIKTSEADRVLKLHNGETLSSESISLDPFPPSAKTASKKTESSSQKSPSNEMSRDDLIKFAKFVHNSKLKSKDMVVEELRNTHCDITSSRAQATRKLDSIARKHRLKNGGGVIWEVKNEILASLGLHDLVKTEEPDDAKPELIAKTAIDFKEKTTQESKAANKTKGTVAMAPTITPTKDKIETKCTSTTTEADTKTTTQPVKTTKSAFSEKSVHAIVSPSACAQNEKEQETSPSRKRKAAPVSKSSMNLLTSFLKKKKTSA